MKKWLAAVLSIVLMISVFPMGAFHVTVKAETEGYYTYAVSNGEATITDVDTKISGDIVIPDTLGGAKVTKIGSNAFEWCRKITGVTIPNTVTSIGEYAFSFCTAIIYVKVPESVAFMGNNAFDSSTSLESVYITDLTAWCNIDFTGYPSNPLSSAEYIYINDELVFDLVIPNTVTEIKTCAFARCTAIETVTIPNSVTTIGGSAFYQCTELRSVTIPNSVTSIESYAFSECTALTSITIPESLDTIKASVFKGCTGLSELYITDTLKSIGWYSFGNCTSLQSVYFLGDDKSSVSIDSTGNESVINATWYCTCRNHLYDNACDTSCSRCGKTRSTSHVYSNNCDVNCNECGLVRTVPGHIYTNACDESCDECGFSRTTTHTYDNVCDASCNICGLVRTDSVHVYDDACDAVCNECHFVRNKIHFFQNNCDAECDLCHFARTPANHVYSGELDLSCNECGELRVVDGLFAIIYHLDGGTNALKNPEVYTEEDVITLMDAEKVGYDFEGWFLDADKTQQVTQISGVGNVDVYAKFTPKGYTAQFNDGVILTVKKEGYADKTLYVPYGTTIDPYSKEFMSEYISSAYSSYYTENSATDPYFSGWYLVKNGTKTKLSKSFTMTTDTTLYCHFDLKNSDDAKYASSYGGVRSMFSGKTENTVGGTKAYTYVRVPTLSDGSFYLQIGLTLGGSISSGTVSVYNNTKGEEIKFLSVSNGDYGKTYWGTQVFYRANPGDILCISTDWAASYSVVFSAPVRASSTMTSSKTTTKTMYYDQIVTPPTPTNKNGYTFLGWYDTQGNQISNIWEYTELQTFTPKWLPTRYYINYSLNGGTNSPANPTFYTIEDAISLSAPTKVGYTFKGWYLDADFTTKITSISKKTGNITLHAKWEVNSYCLTLDANTGVFAPKVTFVSDGVEIKRCYLYQQDTLTAYRPADKDGYIFAGWYTDNTFTTLFAFNGTIENDITLYAKWIEWDGNIVYAESVENIQSTIQGKKEQLYAFVPLNDGDITVTSESNNLDLFGILYDARKNILISADDIGSNDLDFSFTYNVKAGELYYIAVKGNTASTAGQAVVILDWSGDCTITGTTYQSRQLTVVYNTNYKLPTKPIREGYVFLGWFDEYNTQVTDGIWNFVTDKTLTAKWEEATYHTVIFKDAVGNILSEDTYYLSEDIVAPELPQKAPDNTYTYTAKWSNNFTGVCTGDAVYTVVYEGTYIDYTVVFQDWDGTVLSEETYHYGDKVTVPVIPLKEADHTYIYTFAGWDKAVVNCNGNVTYNATYTAQYIEYIVVFQDWDGTVLSEEAYHYGDVVIAPATPTKAADNTYTYTFAGWDSAVVDCVGNATYTATYTTEYVNYTVVFKNWDGSILSTKVYHYGDAVTAPATPTKGSDKTYTYTFAGWDSTVVDCKGNATYTATYTSDYIPYTVIFKDWNGTVLSSNTYHYGDRVTAPANPTRVADKTYTYTFAGWDSTVVDCEGNATYTATYTSNYIDYTVEFKDWDGSVLSTKTYHYGDVVTAPSDPTKGSDKTYTYTFAGWDSPVVDCVGNATYTATYTPNYIDYTVEFKDWDGSVLSTKTYHYGDTVLAPANPTRVADKTYTYTFAGWDSAVVDCVGNATYTATYTPNYIDYTVEFKDWDGSVLSTKTYHYGDTVLAPANPTKGADKTYTYTFAGWNKEVGTCVGSETYTATYTQNYINYTVIFKDWNGTVLSTNTYHYGDAVTAPANPAKGADKTYAYTFAGWDKAVGDCVGNVTYTATYKATYIDYTVEFKNEDGSILSTGRYHYGAAVQEPTAPVKDSDLYGVYVFTGWDSPVTNCTGSKTYTAIYKVELYEYTVKFQNWDGTVLSSKVYHYNDEVTVPNAPVRDANNTYTYTFAGWDKEVTNCAGNTTYIATYTTTYNEYTVEFKDWDGTVLSTNTYHWGDEVAVPADPIRPDDKEYMYTFAGWDNQATLCEGNRVYTAIYNKTEIVVTSIEITTLPNKITYSQGEELDSTGLVVTSYYNNGTSEVITDYTLEGYSSTPGEKTITVTYGNQSATFQVVVEASSLGDVNEDGKIDAKDALAVLKISVGKTEPTEQQKTAADVNVDGDINAKDALEILKYAVGKPSVLDKVGA